ncbi:MAG: ankyrin repeat domain-containing protein, partial [Acidobacteria bacterium]|nr:ankyrin repeat domain-containing protein [Acidobacteriota bacterium]
NGRFFKPKYPFNPNFSSTLLFLAGLYLNTPLHYAVRVKNIEIIKIIFEAGAEIDPENKDGITPLQMTLLSKPFSYPVIRYLLSCGANPQHKCKGRTIAEMAEILSFGEFEDLKNLFLR